MRERERERESCVRAYEYGCGCVYMYNSMVGCDVYVECGESGGVLSHQVSTPTLGVWGVLAEVSYQRLVHASVYMRIQNTHEQTHDGHWMGRCTCVGKCTH